MTQPANAWHQTNSHEHWGRPFWLVSEACFTHEDTLVLKKLLNKVAIEDRTCLLASPKVGITQKTFQASGPFVLLHVHEFVLKKLLNKVLIKDQTSSLTCRKVPSKDAQKLESLRRPFKLVDRSCFCTSMNSCSTSCSTMCQ